ncbi:hypothetical protein EB821_02175 [Candidatus Marinimicrobia bacterium PRS2]|nr:hypothetical protein EB821_02175 [Candidatus Marinimicrobia bacterium PRS2]
MYKLLIFASLLILLNCGRETKDKWYFAKKESKHTKIPNYKNYFPQAEITKQADKKDEIIKKNASSEPLPSFTSISTKKDSPEKEKSAGIFDFLFGNTNSENEDYSNEAICEEILDINKIILVEQNRKLELFTDEKRRFIDQINSMEKKNQREKNQGQDKQQTLEAEIYRLNRLIKILSSEIK